MRASNKKHSFPHSIPTLLNRGMIWVLGISFELRGKEHIRKNHGGVVLINHQSLIDMSGKPTV